MKVLHEWVDDEFYIDLQLSRGEVDAIKDHFLISETIDILGQTINIGVSLPVKEIDDATS